MFYCTYVLKSNIYNWYYIGLTSNLFRRLSDHNKGKVQSTKARVPYKIIYKKMFNNRISARDYEKFLKIRSNKEKLLKKLNYL